MHKGGPLISPTPKGVGLQPAANFAQGGGAINPNRGQYSKRRFEEGGNVEEQPDHRPPPNLVPTPSVVAASTMGISCLAESRLWLRRKIHA